MTTPRDLFATGLELPDAAACSLQQDVFAANDSTPIYWAEKKMPLNIKAALLPIYIALQTMFCSVSKFFLKPRDSSGTILPSLAFDCGMF